MNCCINLVDYKSSRYCTQQGDGELYTEEVDLGRVTCERKGWVSLCFGPIVMIAKVYDRVIVALGSEVPKEAFNLI